MFTALLSWLFGRQPEAPKALTKVEVRHVWEVAYYTQHGFSLKHCARGNRTYMVRRA